jgi:acetate---CoA ligase (ADP-forming)
VATHFLSAMLYPDSIAVIGASKDKTKRGFRSIQKLLDAGYAGALYPINPKEVEILGLKCYPSIADVPAPVDLAVVCTPAHTLPDILALFERKGVKGAVVLAGGFAETGEEGKRLQERMVAVARAHGVRIIGPNTSGIFNTYAACNIVGFSSIRKGGIGLLSQSGNVALSLVTEAEDNGHLGFSIYAGVGNESDIRLDEYLDFLAADENTKVIVAYIEGLKNGRKFLTALRRVTRRKPVVVYKSGRSSAGRGSAKSHTGALAVDYAVSEGVLRQAGALLARKSDEILSIAEALSLLPPLRSRRIAVLSDGGGHATIAADTLIEHGLTLASLSDKTKRRLAAILPPGAALMNPVDVAGGTDTNPAHFHDCARILMADSEVDGLLITGLYGGYGLRFSQSLTSIELATSDRIAKLCRSSGKPLLVHSLYANLHGDRRPAPLSRLREADIPVHESLERAVRCLQALAEFGEVARRPAAEAKRCRERQPEFEAVLARCRRERRSVVLEHEARAALTAAGVAMAPAYLATSDAEAAAAFRRLDRVPVAMKVVSRDIIHKSEAQGVRLDVSDEQAAARAFGDILASAKRNVDGAEIAGVLVTPMAPKGGVEVIIGVVRDPVFDSVMMFGLGGVLVEVQKDVVFRSLPLRADEARAMIEELRSSSVLNGYRGAPAADKDALVQLMLAVSNLCTAFPEIEELDLNPVRVLPRGAAVLDARILV